MQAPRKALGGGGSSGAASRAIASAAGGGVAGTDGLSTLNFEVIKLAFPHSLACDTFRLSRGQILWRERLQSSANSRLAEASHFLSRARLIKTCKIAPFQVCL